MRPRDRTKFLAIASGVSPPQYNEVVAFVCSCFKFLIIKQRSNGSPDVDAEWFKRRNLAKGRRSVARERDIPAENFS